MHVFLCPCAGCAVCVCVCGGGVCLFVQVEDQGDGETVRNEAIFTFFMYCCLVSSNNVFFCARGFTVPIKGVHPPEVVFMFYCHTTLN